MLERQQNKERKYQYNTPTTGPEHIEALYEEVAQGEDKDSAVTRKTLKGYVIEMVQLMRASARSKRRDDEEQESHFWRALILLGMAAAVFIYLALLNSSGWDWLDEKRFAFKVTGTLLALIFVLVQIERTAFFKVLWGFGFTKIIVSIGASALLVFSTGKAAGVINGVFGIDATAFPLSLTFMTGFIFFKNLSPFIFLIGVFAALHALNLFMWFKALLKGKYPEGPLVSSACFLLFACLVMGFYFGWGGNRLSAERLPEVAYKLAHVLDFNSKHSCANVPGNAAVIFIGPSQNVVLTDNHRVDVDSVQAFFEEDLQVPAFFARVECALSQNTAPVAEPQRQWLNP
ncbi:hypothetical protein ACIGCH_05155 [Pseudomonas helleri]|uniref:Uncharacterized protein n=1 Tax=Pseudomonas helleri TaxID=1608996 RepID=A0A6A7YWN8_9PSED|nr:hypothetical protein [Pseudomonas helleri]MQT26653.1 hypothetical protein [Pseudomonas helleri]MQT79630.1 hypothetical protein [Pseudomonas helleri]MQU15991.1 hypothetical protein [Pseudomonas helleri]MQU26029.1 hypothetical protein [Pseudomonas helleri]